MRIVHVNAGWGVGGGTERYLAELVKAQTRAGDSCAAIAGSIDGVADGIEACEVPGLLATDVADPETPARFEAAVARLAPDVVQLHNVTHPGVVERAAELSPAVSFVHDHTPFCPGLNKEYADGGLCDHPLGSYCVERYRGDGCMCLLMPDVGYVARRILNTRRLLRAHGRLSAVVVASQYMRSELERAGVPGELIELAPFYAEARPGPPPSSSRLLLAVSRMVHPDKGIEPLLESLGRLAPGCAAQLVGDGPDRARFEALRDARGLRGVEFAGRLDAAEVVERLQQARVVVLPSMWNEPFGIVGLEAMACGRPVVAFDVGGVRQWLDHERTGLIVPRGDTRALADALERLLADDALADRLGAAALERVRFGFTEREHLATLQAVYQRARTRPLARSLRTGTGG